MATLLSPQQINSAQQAIDDLHGTLARTITIINEVANAAVVNTDDFNAFSDRNDVNVTYTSVQTDIPARIKYLDKADSEQELIFFGRGDSKAVSTNLRQDYGIVRVKVDKQYTDLVRNSTKILVDGKDCQLLFNYSPLTLISTNYVTFYLSRQI